MIVIQTYIKAHIDHMNSSMGGRDSEYILAKDFFPVQRLLRNHVTKTHPI